MQIAVYPRYIWDKQLFVKHTARARLLYILGLHTTLGSKLIALVNCKCQFSFFNYIISNFFIRI